jgi:hypothetical protein
MVDMSVKWLQATEQVLQQTWMHSTPYTQWSMKYMNKFSFWFECYPFFFKVLATTHCDIVKESSCISGRASTSAYCSWSVSSEMSTPPEAKLLTWELFIVKPVHTSTTYFIQIHFKVILTFLLSPRHFPHFRLINYDSVCILFPLVHGTCPTFLANPQIRGFQL